MNQTAQLLATFGFAAVATAASSEPAPTAIPLDVNTPQAQKQAHQLANQPAEPPPSGHRLIDDRSGRKQVGKASIYAPGFEKHKMADGRAFTHAGNAAASKTLPLGTIAKVTNLKTGQTTTVTVEDRGPFVDGRTLDLGKASANQIGLDNHVGVAPVIVAPIAVPQQDGSMRAGAGALPGPATAN